MPYLEYRFAKLVIRCNIEMIQKRVLRSIYPGLHYDDILVLVILQSPKKRRNNIFRKAYFNRLKCNIHSINDS